ncbi:mitochondrial enolase superfamily member 1 [Grus japonensis]|uniref:Mitochondrial enolase superfamily member 1 n=1 Tax=Grus japonensis TaxID=30415 RepID=A0ABC9W679_GRUJA
MDVINKIAAMSSLTNKTETQAFIGIVLGWMFKGRVPSTHHATDAMWREVPEDWRKANVTLVFKKGKEEDSGTYRPVSLTSIPGKVMEQLILGVINKHVVEEKVVVASGQHGFTKGKSCLTNLIAFYDGMTSWVDEGRAVDVVYLDFTHDLHNGTASLLTIQNWEDWPTLQEAALPSGQAGELGGEEPNEIQQGQV